MLVCLISVWFLSFHLLSSANLTRADLPFSSKERGTKVVELKIAPAGGGIYYLPEGKTAGDLLKIAGEKVIPGSFKPLQDGESYTLDESGVLRAGMIENAKRLALGMTIDINEATREDLLLLPGIGEKTAERIWQLRLRGKIKDLEELKEISGIKDGRISVLRKYLHTERSSAF